MDCQFCGQDIKKGIVLCDWCGKRQEVIPQAPAHIKIDKRQPPSDSSPLAEISAASQLPDEVLALFAEDADKPISPIEELKARFAWRITWDTLLHDPLLLVAFVFAALGALRALLNICGFFGDRDIRNIGFDLFVLGVFFGIFQIAWWRWLLFVLFANVVMQVTFIPVAYALDAGDLALQYIFQTAVNIFLIIVMLLRWRRYR